jgi:hypothetical protein
MSLWFGSTNVEPEDHHKTAEAEYHEPEGGGSIYHEEGRILANCGYRFGGPVLEIGTKVGISARYIAEGLEKRGDGYEVHTVDIAQVWPHDGRLHPEFPNIVAYNMSSAAFQPRPFKWAFIDGNHFAPWPARDIRLANLCGCDYIVLHDCGEHVQKENRPGREDCSEARAAALELLPKDWVVWEIDTGSGLFFAVRRRFHVESGDFHPGP